MKIGFDAKRAFNNFTGLGNYSRFVLDALLKYQPNNQYIAYTPKSTINNWPSEIYRSQLTIDGPKSAIHKCIPSYWRSYGIIDQLKSDQIEVFHGLSNELPIGLAKSKIKSVVTIHDLIFLRYPELYPAIDRAFYKKKFKAACQNADIVVAVSEQTKRDIVAFYNIDPQKIRVIYQDCDVAFQQKLSATFLSTILNKYNLTKPFILSVGTIEPRKNQLNLVKAFYEANLPETELVLVGKASKYQSEIEAFIAQKKITERVKILNQVPFSDLPALYQATKLFAYPSFFEGFGIPIVEALHSGVPLLAATGSCLEEAGGLGGIYANPQDINDIAKQLTTCWNDATLRATLIKQGQIHVQTFAASNIATQLQAVYQELVN